MAYNKRQPAAFSPKMIIDIRYIPDYEKLLDLVQRRTTQKNYIYGTRAKVTLDDVFAAEKELAVGGFLPIRYQKAVGACVIGQVPSIGRTPDGGYRPNIRPALQVYIGDEASVIRIIWKIFEQIKDAAAKYNVAAERITGKSAPGKISPYITLATFDRRRGIMQSLPSKSFAFARTIYDLCYANFGVGPGRLLGNFYDKDSIPEDKKAVYNRISEFSSINRGCLELFDSQDKWGTDAPNYLNNYSQWVVDPPQGLAGLDVTDEVDLLDTWNRAFNGEYKNIAKEMTETAFDNWKNVILYRSFTALEKDNTSGVSLDDEYGKQLPPAADCLKKYTVIDGAIAGGRKDPFEPLMKLAAASGITDKKEIMQRHAAAFGITPPEPSREEHEPEAEREEGDLDDDPIEK